MTQPPHNPKAEHACLSAILARGAEALAEVLDRVKGKDAFFVPIHRAIFDAMMALDRAGEAITIDTTTSELRSSGAAERYDIDGALASMSNGVTTRTKDHAEAVASAAKRRNLAQTLRQIAEAALSEPDVSVSVSQARAALDALDAENQEVLVPIRIAVQETREQMERRESGDGNLVYTGFKALDDRGPLEPGNFVTLAGESGHGKTAMGLTIGFNGVMEYDEGAGYIPMDVPISSLLIASGEMMLVELVRRQLSRVTGINGVALRAPRKEWLDRKRGDGWTHRATIDRGLNMIAGTAVTMTRPSVTAFDELLAAARTWAAMERRDRGPDCSLTILVDYLQLFTAPSTVRRGARGDELEGEKAAACKRLARELGAVVIGLSQVTLDDPGRRALVSDIRGSKAIRHASDHVWILHRPWCHASETQNLEAEYRGLRNEFLTWKRACPGEPNDNFPNKARLEVLSRERHFAELGLGKARGGSGQEWIPLEFRPEITTFFDKAPSS